MTYTHTHMLLSDAWAKGLTVDGSDGISTYLPANGALVERATSLLWAGRVRAITGTPTTWELRFYPEIAIPHTSGLQYSQPAWIPVTPASLGMTVRGATINGDHIMIANNASTLPVPFQIGIPQWMGRAIRFRTEIVHTGTAPKIHTALTLLEKGE